MRHISATLFLLIGFIAFGQDAEGEEKTKRRKKNKKDTSEVLIQPLRIEIPIEDVRDDFEVIDGYEDGLLIVQNTNEDVENGEIWTFHMVDNELQKKWDINQIIPDGSDLVAYDYGIGYYFLLFDTPSRFKKFKALVVDVRGENVVVHEFETPFVMTLSFFEALDNGILLVGQHNFRPVALVYDLSGGKAKVLPGFYNHNEHVFDVVMDEENRAFSIVLAERMRNGKYTNRIKTFTFDGLLVVENIISPGEDLNLVDGTTTSFGSGIQYMVGTYSFKNTDYSRGIYISKFVNGQQRFLQEHNYGDLNNFFAYRGTRAAKRIARRVERKKAKGKKPRFNYKLFIHEVIRKGDLNIIVAEAYYARYASGNRYYNGLTNFNSPYAIQPNTYGQPIRANNFLGYKFTHAIIVAFDSKGNIVWDNSFSTNDITSYNLQESVAANIQGEKAAISYLDDGLIKSKVIEGNQVLEGKTYSPIKLLNKGDKLTLKSSEIRGVRNWYDNYLFSYGIQKIRNKEFPKGERRRKVFYINKLEFNTELEKESNLPITFQNSTFPSDLRPGQGVVVRDSK